MTDSTTSIGHARGTADANTLMQRLQALVAQDKGSPLGEPARSQAAELLGSALAHPMPASPPFALQLEPRELTVLDARLRGGPVVAQHAPDATSVEQLNRILARLIDVALKHNGQIDSLGSNALRVHFGADDATPGNVEGAVMCAVEMQMALRDINLDFLRDRVAQVFMGIGLSMGTALVGRLGNDAYSRPCVVGDVQLLAQRLQSFSLRGQVLIDDAIYQRCWGLVSASAPSSVFLKGLAEPVTVRELVAIPTRKLKVPRQEFRRSHRVPVRIPVAYQLVQDGVVMPHVARGTIRDLGYHGALLELAEPAPLQGELRMSFELPLVNHPARDVYARVITLQSEGQQQMAGVEFTATQAEFDAGLQSLVQLMVTAV